MAIEFRLGEMIKRCVRQPTRYQSGQALLNRPYGVFVW
jgi:hypothetical protein